VFLFWNSYGRIHTSCFSEKERHTIWYIAQHEDICSYIFNSVFNYDFPQTNATNTMTDSNQLPMMKK
jgi:hypothetical protein